MKCRFLSFLTLVLGISSLPSVSLSEGSPVHTAKRPHIRINLVASDASVGSDTGIRIGVRFRIEKGWHIYWKNPGDSGLPTSIKWSGAPGLTFSDVEYPTPEVLDYEGLVNYGYEKTALLSSSLAVEKNLIGAPGPIPFSAKVSWVLCKDECIPGEADLKSEIRAGRVPDSIISTELFKPGATKPLADQSIKAIGRVEEKSLVVTISHLPTNSKEAFRPGVLFIPESAHLLRNTLVQKTEYSGDNSVILTLDRASSSKPLPENLSGLLLIRDALGGKTFKALHVTINSTLSSVTDSDGASGGEAFVTLVLSAFLGGIILNLMPCVFPVLSLKILEIARLGSSPKAKLESAAFAIGVTASFLVLASLLVFLKTIGHQIGWGFQFQSPLFVACMAMLIFVIGLNLSGVFEFGMSIQAKAGGVKLSHGLKGSFLNGVLATALATPCTAPFMGSAIAYAISASVAEAFLVFVALGLGMSSPYLLLAAIPSIGKIFPKPGAWMERLKQGLSFPMYATSTWLLWVLGMQSGLNGVIACISSFVLLASGAWILGTWGAIHCRKSARRLATFAAATLAVGGIGIVARYVPLGSGIEEASAASPKTNSPSPSNSGWEAYSEARLAQVLSSGKPVLIDFTAAWCLVCQVNHSRVLESEDIKERLQSRDVVLLRADWTSRDSEVTRGLAKFGKTSVPLLVLMKEGAPPISFESLVNPEELASEVGKLPEAKLTLEQAKLRNKPTGAA